MPRIIQSGRNRGLPERAHYLNNRIIEADSVFNYWYDFKKRQFDNLELSISKNEEHKITKFIEDGKILDDNTTIYNSKFEYDNSGNWFKEESYENGNLTVIVEREISY